MQSKLLWRWFTFTTHYYIMELQCHIEIESLLNNKIIWNHRERSILIKKMWQKENCENVIKKTYTSYIKRFHNLQTTLDADKHRLFKEIADMFLREVPRGAAKCIIRLTCRLSNWTARSALPLTYWAIKEVLCHNKKGIGQPGVVWAGQRDLWALESDSVLHNLSTPHCDLSYIGCLPALLI